jgi:hypothetical protein
MGDANCIREAQIACLPTSWSVDTSLLRLTSLSSKCKCTSKGKNSRGHDREIVPFEGGGRLYIWFERSLGR